MMIYILLVSMIMFQVNDAKRSGRCTEEGYCPHRWEEDSGNCKLAVEDASSIAEATQICEKYSGSVLGLDVSKNCTDLFCQLKLTDVNAVWGSWYTESYCDMTCGGGIRKLKRNCQSSITRCCGIRRKYESCNKHRCPRPVDGKWGKWRSVGSCSKNCNGGEQKQERDCNQPSPKHGGNYCSGDSYKNVRCNTHSCSKK